MHDDAPADGEAPVRGEGPIGRDIDRDIGRAAISYPAVTEYRASAEVIAYVILKLVGFYYLVSFVVVLVTTLPILWMRWETGRSEDWLNYLVVLVAPLVGSLLLIFSGKLAHYLFGSRDIATADLRVDQMVALICVGCGILLAARALPEVFAEGLYFVNDMRARNAAGSGFSGNYILAEHLRLILTIAQLGIAAFLFIRPDWVVGQFRRRTRMPESAG